VDVRRSGEVDKSYSRLETKASIGTSIPSLATPDLPRQGGVEAWAHPANGMASSRGRFDGEEGPLYPSTPLTPISSPRVGSTVTEVCPRSRARRSSPPPRTVALSRSERQPMSKQTGWRELLSARDNQDHAQAVLTPKQQYPVRVSSCVIRDSRVCIGTEETVPQPTAAIGESRRS
jgi:hypothetical protein